MPETDVPRQAAAVEQQQREAQRIAELGRALSAQIETAFNEALAIKPTNLKFEPQQLTIVDPTENPGQIVDQLKQENTTALLIHRRRDRYSKPLVSVEAGQARLNEPKVAVYKVDQADKDALLQQLMVTTNNAIAEYAGKHQKQSVRLNSGEGVLQMLGNAISRVDQIQGERDKDVPQNRSPKDLVLIENDDDTIVPLRDVHDRLLADSRSGGALPQQAKEFANEAAGEINYLTDKLVDKTDLGHSAAIKTRARNNHALMIALRTPGFAEAFTTTLAARLENSSFLTLGYMVDAPKPVATEKIQAKEIGTPEQRRACWNLISTLIREAPLTGLPSPEAISQLRQIEVDPNTVYLSLQPLVAEVLGYQDRDGRNPFQISETVSPYEITATRTVALRDFKGSIGPGEGRNMRLIIERQLAILKRAKMNSAGTELNYATIGTDMDGLSDEQIFGQKDSLSDFSHAYLQRFLPVSGQNRQRDIIQAAGRTR